MIPPAPRRVQVGILLVVAGLLVQMATSFFWSPGAFIVSAGIGLPLVVLGVLGLWIGLRGAGRSP